MHQILFRIVPCEGQQEFRPTTFAAFLHENLPSQIEIKSASILENWYIQAVFYYGVVKLVPLSKEIITPEFLEEFEAEEKRVEAFHFRRLRFLAQGRDRRTGLI